MDIVKEEKYHGFTIKIAHDPNPLNPRRDCDPFGKMICFHGRYDLGDEHSMSMEELEEIVARKDVVSLPLYLYDHSGITMNTTGFHCPWDSGQVGHIYADADMIRENWGVKRVTPALREKARKLLKAGVESYDDYITGNAYGYIIEDAEGDHKDSCWGFLGDDGRDEAFKEAKSIVESYPWQPGLPLRKSKGTGKRSKRTATHASVKGVR
jgi:hypothetical protein